MGRECRTHGLLRMPSCIECGAMSDLDGIAERLESVELLKGRIAELEAQLAQAQAERERYYTVYKEQWQRAEAAEAKVMTMRLAYTELRNDRHQVQCGIECDCPAPFDVPAAAEKLLAAQRVADAAVDARDGSRDVWPLAWRSIDGLIDEYKALR